MQASQAVQKLFAASGAESTSASVRRQANLTLGPNSGVINKLCRPMVPRPANCPACLNENIAVKNR
jgi:hypothetical protein